MLRTTCEQQGALIFVKLQGELAAESVEQFTAAAHLYSPDTRTARVDCKDLTFLDSTGTNALLQAVLHWKEAGITVEVENLSDELHEMLDIFGFFEILAESA